MALSQKEKAIQEKRTIEATKKNMMGSVGKLGMIVQVLGDKIIKEDGGLYDIGYLEDPYTDNSEVQYETTMSGQNGPEIGKDELPYTEFSQSQELGYVFDGLSRGMHLEIKFWHHNQRIDVTYKGYLVYKEIAGELFCYAPFDDWEDMIVRLHKAAKEKSKDLKHLREMAIGETIEEEKRSFWEKLRMRWGV